VTCGSRERTRPPSTRWAGCGRSPTPGSVSNELEDGDWVVQEFTFEGTHDNTLSGPAGDILPTNRRLTGRGVQILRVENGKVAEARLYYDQVQVMTQLGLMPEPAAATA